jgi:hypothetical protein
MMMLPDLADFVSSALEIPNGTAVDRAKVLRGAGLLSVGKQGPHGHGARMTNTDAINLLLANILDHKRGASVADNVQRVRDLPSTTGLVEMPHGFTRGLTLFDADTAGDALDGILNDIRTGRLNAWAAGERWNATVTLDTCGARLFVSIGKPDKRNTHDLREAMHAFALPGENERKRLVDRSVTIAGEVFLQLAEALESTA